jgi:phosphoglycolate phosphatase-like HAD superfamily hydrolase
MWSADAGPLALDLDGTLIDARRRQLSVLASVLAVEVDLGALWERKREGATTAAALAALGVPDDVAAAAASRWVERIEDEDELRADRFLPGVEATLAELAAAGVQPTVVTARTHPDRARAQFAALGLERWCEGLRVVDPADAAEQKAAVLRELGAAAYVGDTESDARAAALAEIPFAAVSTGQRSAAFLADRGLTPHPSLAAALTTPPGRRRGGRL